MTTKLRGCSDMKVTKVTYEWEIKNFSSQLPEVGKPLLSPVFYSSANKEDEWQLYIKLKGDGEKTDYISLYLKLKNSKRGQIQTNYSFYIWNSELSNNDCDVRIWKVGQYFGYSRILKRSTLLDKTMNYLVNDSLIVCCNLETYVDVSYNLGEVDTEETVLHTTIANHRFVNDLELFINEAHPLNADLTIMCESQKFEAHALVLAVRSPTFLSILKKEQPSENENKETKLDNVEIVKNDNDDIELKNETIEIEDQEITIVDLTPEVLKEMLHYIYTDKIRNEGLALELLDASEKYQLNGLKAMCELIFIKNLHQTNAAEVLEVSSRHNAEQLKKSALNFICDHEEEIWATDAFVKLMESCPLLLAEIYNTRICKHMNTIVL